MTSSPDPSVSSPARRESWTRWKFQDPLQPFYLSNPGVFQLNTNVIYPNSSLDNVLCGWWRNLSYLSGRCLLEASGNKEFTLHSLHCSEAFSPQTPRLNPCPPSAVSKQGKIILFVGSVWRWEEGEVAEGKHKARTHTPTFPEPQLCLLLTFLKPRVAWDAAAKGKMQKGCHLIKFCIPSVEGEIYYALKIFKNSTDVKCVHTLWPCEFHF